MAPVPIGYKLASASYIAYSRMRTEKQFKISAYFESFCDSRFEDKKECVAYLSNTPYKKIGHEMASEEGFGSVYEEFLFFRDEGDFLPNINKANMINILENTSREKVSFLRKRSVYNRDELEKLLVNSDRAIHEAVSEVSGKTKRYRPIEEIDFSDRKAYNHSASVLQTAMLCAMTVSYPGKFVPKTNP